MAEIPRQRQHVAHALAKTNLHTNVAKALHILHNHGDGERGGGVVAAGGGRAFGRSVVAAEKGKSRFII